MIDFIKLSIPFKYELVISDRFNPEVSYIDLEDIAKKSGIKLKANSVEWEIPVGKQDEQLRVFGLSHPWDSVPSSFSGIAMKVYAGGKLRFPCVELKCSPAKILQGHNVFGSDSLELCGFEMLACLAAGCPDLYALLDVPHTQLDWVDCTYSARTPNQRTAMQCIQALKHVRAGQIKPSLKSGCDYDTTVYWNKDSEVCERKAYIKELELDRDLASIEKKFEKIKHQKENIFTPENKQLVRRKNFLSEFLEPLRQFSVGLVRFETRLKQKKLADLGIPRLLFDAIDYQKVYEAEGKSLIHDLWLSAFKDLFKAFEGAEVNIYNSDSVHDNLKKCYFRYTPKGNISYSKADKLFDFYTLITTKGYENIRESWDGNRRTTFWRYEKDLLAAGISRQQLQGFTGGASGEVVPLVKMLEIDFSNQVPAWAPKIVSQFTELAA